MKFILLLGSLLLYSCAESPDEKTKRLQKSLKESILLNKCQGLVNALKPNDPNDIYLTISKSKVTKEPFCDIIYRKQLIWIRPKEDQIDDILGALAMKYRIQRDKEGYENITDTTTNN